MYETLFNFITEIIIPILILLAIIFVGSYATIFYTIAAFPITIVLGLLWMVYIVHIGV